jgi:hypothetical protein
MITKRTALEAPTGDTEFNTSAITAYVQLNPYYLQLVQLVQVSLGTRKPFFCPYIVVVEPSLARNSETFYFIFHISRDTLSRSDPSATKL